MDGGAYGARNRPRVVGLGADSNIGAFSLRSEGASRWVDILADPDRLSRLDLFSHPSAEREYAHKPTQRWSVAWRPSCVRRFHGL